ncbi:Reverse transcriptase RNA-dependent DNA polymerase [Trinorchestia longiramus]|nr:Reverse transcriptase RNA-dependent DNA polymerase [Trinorchestia longiramus]
MGVGVMQTKNEVFLEQFAYTKALLSRFGMDKENSVATPVDINADLVTTSDEVEECDEDLYQSAVESDSGKVIIIVWVDDLILASSNAVGLGEVKRLLSNKFKMKDLGPISCFLGIEFVVKQDSIEMKQSKYVEKILSKFRMSDCNPKSIPCDPSANKLDVRSDSKNLCDPKLFREIVGSLIYLMTCSITSLLMLHFKVMRIN